MRPAAPGADSEPRRLGTWSSLGQPLGRLTPGAEVSFAFLPCRLRCPCTSHTCGAGRAGQLKSKPSRLHGGRSCPQVFPARTRVCGADTEGVGAGAPLTRPTGTDRRPPPGDGPAFLLETPSACNAPRRRLSPRPAPSGLSRQTARRGGAECWGPASGLAAHPDPGLCLSGRGAASGRRTHDSSPPPGLGSCRSPGQDAFLRPTCRTCSAPRLHSTPSCKSPLSPCGPGHLCTPSKLALCYPPPILPPNLSNRSSGHFTKGLEFAVILKTAVMMKTF